MTASFSRAAAFHVTMNAEAARTARGPMAPGRALEPTVAPAADDAVHAGDDLRMVELAGNDPRAFAPIYEKYADPVYYFCYRRLGDPHDAADAAALVFTRAIANLRSFRPKPNREGSTFRAWLYTIARNVVTDAYRRQRPQVSLDRTGDDDNVTPAPIDAAPSPEDVAIGAEEARLVDALLLRLPERQRWVVELRLAGLTMAEIATTLSITESAAKSLQVRAYRALRDLLQSDPHAISREIPT
jgi:RNA polymerase sigma-70 factor (ECF subfamily)